MPGTTKYWTLARILGTWTRPHHSFEGAVLLPEGDTGTDEQKWQEIKAMWADWDS